MTEFMKIMLELTSELMQGASKVQTTDIEKLQVYYRTLKESERKRCLEILRGLLDGELETYVYLLSFLLANLQDNTIKNELESIFENEKFPLLNSIVYWRFLKKKVFVSGNICENQTEYERQIRLYSNHVKGVQKLLKQQFSYIPYEERNKKRVVLLIEPIFWEKHAPTKKMVNIYSYFQAIGYKVLVVATHYKWMELARCTQWWNALVDNGLYDATGRFTINFMGVDIEGANIAYKDSDYIDDVSLGMEIVREYNPEFVMSIGDRNILAGLCNDFTTVVTMPCVNKAPISIEPIVLRYFEMTEEEKNEYQKKLQGKKILEYKHINELQPEGDGVDRAIFGISEEAFVIVIAGNRLDFEVTEVVQKMLLEILEENDDTVVVFIGKCKSLENRLGKALEETEYAHRFYFLGEQDNFKEAIGLGNVFLNPPRQGGGTGAVFAIEKEVPIITLGNCDVASFGEEFVCDKLEDMPRLVKRYITDADYMQQQKLYCRKRAIQRGKIDSIGNLKILCSEIQKEIIRIEQEREYE